jgi:hypothetical protein
VSEADIKVLARQTIMEAFKPDGVDWDKIDRFYLRHASPLQDIHFWVTKQNIKFNKGHRVS